MPSLTTKPLYVVLDTCIFENENFNFNSHDLSILKQYTQDGTIARLIIPDIVIGESQKHFRDRIKKANERIDALLDGRELRPFSATKSLCNYVRRIDDSKLFSEMVGVMNAYLSATSATILKTNKIKLKDVLDDYYNIRPPFGTGKKTHEFRDDIIIRRLREVVDVYGEIVSVSTDGDWKDALKDDQRFIFYSNLEDLFSSITKEKALTQKTQEYFSMHRNEIESHIENRLFEIPCDVDGLEYDNKGVVGGVDYISSDIQEISVRSKISGIDYIGEGEVIARLFTQAHFCIECVCRDENKSIWDADDKDYCYEEFIPIIEEHILNLSVAITFSIKDGEVDGVKKIEPFIKNKMLHFDTETRTGCHSKNFDGFFSYKQVYQCEQCGHKICIDLIDYAETSSAIADRGMGPEIEHTISHNGECPRCGKQFEISGAIYEYPMGALNDDSTIIKWK